MVRSAGVHPSSQRMGPRSPVVEENNGSERSDLKRCSAEVKRGPRGCPRRSARVFRAHRDMNELNEKSKIIVFQGNVKKVSAEVSAAIN